MFEGWKVGRFRTNLPTFQPLNLRTRSDGGKPGAEFVLGDSGNAEALVAGFLAGEQLDLRAFDAEEVGEEVAAGAVGGAFHRRRGEAQEQHSLAPARHL